MIFRVPDFLACMREDTVSATCSLKLSVKIAETVFRPVPRFGHVSALRFWWLPVFGVCMHTKPQFRQHGILLIKTLVPTVLRETSRTILTFVYDVSQPRARGFGFPSRACERNRSFANILSWFWFHFVFK